MFFNHYKLEYKHSWYHLEEDEEKKEEKDEEDEEKVKGKEEKNEKKRGRKHLTEARDPKLSSMSCAMHCAS